MFFAVLFANIRRIIRSVWTKYFYCRDILKNSVFAPQFIHKRSCSQALIYLFSMVLCTVLDAQFFNWQLHFIIDICDLTVALYCLC